MGLRPLTIGHLAILHDARSPFVTFEGLIHKPELVYAVGVCAQPYQAALECGKPVGWWESIKLEWVTWKWARMIAKLDLEKEVQAFADYLGFHRQYPDFVPPKGETRSLNSPIEWRLAGMLMECYGLTFTEAMETPVLRAHALWAVSGDREGWLELEPNDPVSESRSKQLNEWARQEDARFDAGGSINN